MSDTHDPLQSFEGAFVHYIDHLNQGRAIDKSEVRERFPQFAEPLLEKLESYEFLAGELSFQESIGKIGDYTLRRQIGRGGMGVVYEAWQHSMDRVVALKVLPSGVAADDRAYGRFMQEARAAGKLSHPNLVAVHASGQDEHTPYYAMEWVCQP